MAEPVLNEETIRDLKTAFDQLDAEITVSVFTKKGENDQYNQIATQLIEEISGVDSRIKSEFHDIGDAESERLGVQSSPTTLICPDKYRIMFRGAPLGEEGRTLVMSMILASTGQGALKESSVKKLQKLDERRLVKIFVSPT
jgi:thioredoxin reductase (NADPH)